MKINEVFETIQGEATHTGTPAVFVRTQYCPIGCPWCDTKHTWVAEDPKRSTFETILAKTQDSDRWAEAEPAVILQTIQKRFTARHLVLTGGEPMMQPDIDELCRLALKEGWSVQIESSGTTWTPIPQSVWLTVSPKIDMPGGYKLDSTAIWRADEIKMPVGKQADIDRLEQLIDHYAISPRRIWLQPLSQSAKATQLCIETATKNNWRISIQTHKYLNVR
jgi:7-carboxy-7-deazaguanine synthase